MSSADMPACPCMQLLYFWCAALQKRSDSMAALAEDHLNDVMSNAGAIVTAGVASLWSHGWWAFHLVA